MPKFIDGSYERKFESRYTAIAKELFDVSLILQAHGDNLKALTPKKKANAAVRNNPWCGQPHIHGMIGYLICKYYVLGHWEDARRELKVHLGLNEYITAEHFPITSSICLHVANDFKANHQLTQADDFTKETTST